jgi:hypothetical protein
MSKKITKKDLIVSIKKLYPYYNNLEGLKKGDLLKIIDKSCNNIPIYNERNSCYLDSLMVALFHDDNQLVKNMFLESAATASVAATAAVPDDKNERLIKISEDIREELKNIYNIIQNNNSKRNYCKNLRSLFQSYNKIRFPKNNIKWTTEQLEPFDIINLLNNIFIIKPTIKVNKKLYGTNKLSKTIVFKNLKLFRDETKKTDYTSVISMDDFLAHNKFPLKKYYPIAINDAIFDEDNLWRPSDKKSDLYKRKIEKTTLLSGKFLFININRSFISDDGNFEKSDKIVEPSLKIKMKENKYNIYLRSIIIHHGVYGGGHYICLYECKGKWHKYDDLTAKVDVIGTFLDLCKYDNGYYLKNCTNLVYY